MPLTLLTEDQRRHLTVGIHLLLADLARLAERPELGSKTGAFAGARTALERTRASAQRLLSTLGVEGPRPRSVRREVQAVAGVWWGRVNELSARAMRAYGPVHPDLPETLDPMVADLREQLGVLRDCAQHLPEH